MCIRDSNRRKCVPYHYLSSDGFDIYVGKNNYQNEELTFKFAQGNDIWMHAKKTPGSHVIIQTNGREVPDRTYEAVSYTHLDVYKRQVPYSLLQYPHDSTALSDHQTLFHS